MRHHRFLTVALLLLAVAGLAAPATGTAGELTQVLCADPATGHGMGGLPPEITNPHSTASLGLVATHSDCTGEMSPTKGLVLRSIAAHYADDEWGAIAYDAPEDLSIKSADLYRAFTAPPQSTWFETSQHAASAGVMFGVPYGERFEWTFGPETSVGTPSNPSSPSNLLAAAVSGGHWIVHMHCDSHGRGGCDIAAGQSEYRIFGGQVVLVDDHDPQVTGPMSGSLLGDPVLRDDEELVLSLIDVGAGVYRARLLVDGQQSLVLPIDANGGHCVDVNPDNDNAFEFDRGRPCKLSAGATLAFDTTKLPEGQHNVKVVVDDAAGNPVTPLNRTATIDNVPPPAVAAPPSLTGRPSAGELMVTTMGTWTGAGIGLAVRWQRSSEGGWADVPGATEATYRLDDADTGRHVRSCVVATSVEGTTEACSGGSGVVSGRAAQGGGVLVGSVVAPVSSGSPGGAGVHVSAGFGASGARSRAVGYGRGTTVSGRLVSAGGQPVAGAVVEVHAAIRVVAGTMARVGEVVTDGSGRFAYVAPPGASRLIRFGYRGADGLAWSADVELKVRAGVRFHLDHPHRRNGQRVRYLGRLLGTRAGRRFVDVQVRSGRGWQIVCSVKTRTSGRFACAHQFTRTFSRTTYAFRARARKQAGLPYESGVSRTVVATVTP
jgi:hypothetical protein